MSLSRLRMRFQLPDPASDLRWMLKKMRPQDKMYVGIDPGITGAIAFVPTRRKIDPIIVDLPITTVQVKTTRKGKTVKGNRNEYDVHKIVALLDPLIDFRDRVVIALERGQPYREDTPKTAFSVGVGFGMWGLYFAAFGLKVHHIMPAVWKRRMGLSGGSENKEHSRAKCRHLYPGAHHFVEFVGDHNRAEAMLLAEYQRRLDTGEHKWAKRKRTLRPSALLLGSKPKRPSTPSAGRKPGRQSKSVKDPTISRLTKSSLKALSTSPRRSTGSKAGR